jgi:dienelactone hydrolase
MKNKIIIVALLFVVVAGIVFWLWRPFHSSPRWIIEEVTFKARDGFELSAYVLRPRNLRSSGKKYPAVACFHQLWGNRDDFLKLFPFLADAGVIAIAPNFLRQKPTMSPTRISDLADTVAFLEKAPGVDAKRLGIITASFSVETGLMAIRGKKNVIAAVMLSGPVLSESSRKWLTLNSDLAIFAMTSIYDAKPNDPPKHHLIMEECLARNLNPLSRSMFIDDKKNRFSIFAHGTFSFDEFPEILEKLQKFFIDVFAIKTRENGVIEELLPKYTVFYNSTDGFPIMATFKQPRLKTKMPAVILYPPQFMSRTFYEPVINSLIARGIAVLAPNTKRTCREARTLHLCEKEIGGAVNYLKNLKDIDPDRIAILFPCFYYLSARDLIERHVFPVKSIIFMETGDMDYGVNPREIKSDGYRFYYLDEIDFRKMVYLIKRAL